jgi:anti-sigma B factor antagonist
VQSAIIQRKLFLSWDGEVSFRNVEELSKPINEAAEGNVNSIQIDIRDVTFIDSSGLQALVSARRRFPSTGSMQVIVTPGSQPDRVLRLAKLEMVLGLVTRDGERRDKS